MKQKRKARCDDWDADECKTFIEQLGVLRTNVLEAESRLSPLLDKVDRNYRPRARNLAHYFALRHTDLRPLQEKLAWIGVSSLGRAESNVLANLDKVLSILHRLLGPPWQSQPADDPVGIKRSRKLQEQHTASLLGDPPQGRSVRIMVTLPSEASSDYGLVRQLVDVGADIARINCAHDSPTEWKAMARNIRRAAKTAGHHVRILMDLGGPKLRTDHLPPAISVLKLRPNRDEMGRVQISVMLGLYPVGKPAQINGAGVCIGVDADWLAHIAQENRLRINNARGARRDFGSWIGRGRRSGGVVPDQLSHPETRIAHRRKGHRSRVTRIFDLPAQPASLYLARGSTIYLLREKVGADRTA